jgi:hypothetical protein
MAQIELRHATIRVSDGFTATAAVNNVSGYLAGATTMLMNTVVGGPIPVLASFHLAGHGETYIVTSTDGASTITFSPGLEAAVADDAVIDFGGRTLEIKIGTGNVTYNEQRQMQYTLDRGTLDTVREGDDVPMDVALDFIWEFITAVTGSGTPTIEDALKNRGEASTWVTSSADPCEPFAVDITIQHTPPCGNEEVETIVFPDFRYESLNHNLRDAAVAVTGKCNAKEAIVDRAAA